MSSATPSTIIHAAKARISAGRPIWGNSNRMTPTIRASRPRSMNAHQARAITIAAAN